MKILDVQGYLINKTEFIPKELAIFDGEKVSHYIFKPPFKYYQLTKDDRKQVVWLENYYHGLMWGVGWTSLQSFKNILQYETKNDSIIYVKGFEKTNFIRKYLGNIVQEYPETEFSLRNINRQPYCFYHNIPYGHCALVNVKLLYENLYIKKLSS